MKTPNLKLLAITCALLLSSCGPKDNKAATVETKMVETVVKEPVYDTNRPETILAAIEYAHGGWNGLWKKGDVEYTYDYRSPETGKADVSLERYIFGSEISYGNYGQHQINFMQDSNDKVIQYFDGNETTVLVNGDENQNPELLGVSDFLRRTNYYWFTMHYKLNDKGAKAKYLGQEDYKGKTYDKIEVSYDAEVTGKEQNDSYIILVNPETKLIDRFFFSIPFLGVDEPVIAANYEYENIDGQLISTKRSYFMPSEQGYSEEPSLIQTLKNIKFGNGFTAETIQQ
ncbi:DUF6503 family protein [Flagellimonas sp.]|uniref:DUF6503 family protein n=1 Tax=Flagellimonas sp. TaxID=2058762 RepID=UPI003B5BF9EC